MKRGCRNCMWLYHMVTCNSTAPCSECLDYNKWQTTKQTNADRIRAMTDEELAKFLEERVSDVPWCNEEAPFKPGSDECALEDCTKCALEWLKREGEA